MYKGINLWLYILPITRCLTVSNGILGFYSRKWEKNLTIGNTEVKVVFSRWVSDL